MKIFILTSILTAFFACTADADSCRAVQVQRQRVVHAAVVQHHHAVAAVVAPVAVAQYLPIQVPTYSAGYVVDNGETAALRRSIERLEKTIQKLSATPTSRAAPVPDVGITGQAQQVLTARCAQCHTGAAAKGSLAIFTEPGKLNPAVDRFVLWEAADSGQMPPAPAKEIPDDEARVLREWVKEAAQVRKAQALKK